MMWYTFFLPLLLLNGNFNGAYLVHDEARPLTWRDFRDAPKKQGNIVALTTSGLSLESTNVNKVNSTITLLIEARFYHDRSWGQNDSDTYILKHEQGHFDLVEIAARDLRKELSGLTIKASEFNKTIKTIKLRHDRDLKREQNKYDEQTEHSIDRKKQAQWDSEIAKDLEKTKEYRKRTVTIKYK